MNLTIRDERPEDLTAVYEVNRLAFGREDEANLVADLRPLARPFISLVAIFDETVVGHLLFTRVDIQGENGSGTAMGLGPVAVLPDFQKRKVGSRLIEAGLNRSRQLGQNLVFVLGHPDYYRRFDFLSARSMGFYFRSADTDPYFFVLELLPGAADNLTGEVKYLPPFEKT